MNDESEEVKKAIDKTNSRVLAYAHEVLEESKGVRPLFPIIKVIEVKIILLLSDIFQNNSY